MLTEREIGEGEAGTATQAAGGVSGGALAPKKPPIGASLSHADRVRAARHRLLAADGDTMDAP